MFKCLPIMDTGCIPPTVNFFQYTSPFRARDFCPLLRLSRISSKYFSKSNRGTEWRILATPHPDY
ncbi:hypothetical protein CLI83_07220 [Porphyromonas gingivalis]|nr:hypothetical protein CLI83_07220 [Porphyromonas gingivalis]